MKRFAMIGAAGYVAIRHLRAIKDTGNELVAALDVNDSMGVLDSYFPDAEFFTEFEEFAGFVQDLRLKGEVIDYMSICSPNYLHLAHIKFSLQNGINVICEKPMVLNPTDLDVVKVYERNYNAKVNSILQLRLHPSIIALRKKVASAAVDTVFDVKLTYLTSRGKWYLKSWKGFEEKSGGVATNIGVHFYDMLGFVFGKVMGNEVHYRDQKTSSGYLKFERARVSWFLSIDSNFLPENAVVEDKATFRSIVIEGEELEFSRGFTDLHTESYQNIIMGNGFGAEENRLAIETVTEMRSAMICSNPTNPHPLFYKVKG